MANILRNGIDAYRQSMNLPNTGEASQVSDGKKPNAGASLAIAQESIAKAKERLKDGQGLLKTTLPPVGKEPKVRRVAKLLILIGSDQAAKILGDLDAAQVEEITREIALIDGIDPEDARSILAEFKSLFATAQPSSGGIETARRILHSVYGPEKGEALLNKTIPESKENIFGFLEDFSAEQIVFLLKDEKPMTTALILARLPPKTSAEVIAKFSAALKAEVLIRMARKSEVAPEVLQSVAEALRERARLLGGGGEGEVEIDGMQTLAAILKQGDYSFGDRLLGELENENPEVGLGIKSRLYTLDDVLDVHDRALADKLKKMNDKEIAILLKGRGIEFREKILSNVSSGRRHMIAEEGQIMGPVSRGDWDEVANEFIAWYRQARADGEIALKNDEEWVT